MTATLPAFAATAFVLAMLPGPGQAVMTRQVLDHGRRPAMFSTLGTGAGLIVWALLAAAGALVLLQHPTGLLVARWVGATLLVVLGVRTLLSRSAARADSEADRTPTAWSSFGTGLLTNLGNPKAGLFALAVLPQFLPVGGDTFWTTLGLGAVWSAATMAWFVLFVSLVGRFSALFTSAPARRRLAIGSGLALMAIGATVAFGL